MSLWKKCTKAAEFNIEVAGWYSANSLKWKLILHVYKQDESHIFYTVTN